MKSMKIKPAFPEHRLHDLKRQAELAVYRDLEASALPGITVYSSSAGPASPEIDYSVWLKDIGRYAVEVKGGQYALDNGIWLLAGPGGRVAKPNPLMQTYDAGMSLRNAIGERLSHKRKPYVICVTLFADMEEDEGIEACTEGGQSKILWGTEDVATRLAAIAAEVGIDYPPSARDGEEESSLLVPGLGCQFRDPALPAGVSLDGRPVIIQNVEHLHLHTSAAPETPM